MFGFIKTRKTQTSLSYPDRSSTMEGRMGYSFRGQAWGQNRLVLKKTLKDRAATLVKDATHHRVHRPNGFSWPKRRQEQKESWSVSHNFVRSSHEPIALLWPTLNSGQKKKSERETQTDQLTPGILHSSLAFLVRLTGCLIIDASPQQQKWESISKIMIIERLSLILQEDMGVGTPGQQKGSWPVQPIQTNQKIHWNFSDRQANPCYPTELLRNLRVRAQEAQHWVAMKRWIEILSADHRVNSWLHIILDSHI